jgi:hypothetical protein
MLRYSPDNPVFDDMFKHFSRRAYTHYAREMRLSCSAGGVMRVLDLYYLYYDHLVAEKKLPHIIRALRSALADTLRNARELERLSKNAADLAELNEYLGMEHDFTSAKYVE